MILREGTSDKDVYEAVHDHNEYRLPDSLNDWIVIDIGAHIGAFAYTCLKRGAAHVYAYEPDGQNYIVADQNLRGFGEQVTLSKLAVWGSGPVKYWPLRLSGYNMLGTTINTGGCSVVFGQGLEPVPAIEFDDAIDLALDYHEISEIDLIKMDCEGSEWPCLFTSKRLESIKRLVGEFHEGVLPFSLYGRIQFGIDDLVNLLEKHNFMVSYERHGTISEGLGLFFAERKT